MKRILIIFAVTAFLTTVTYLSRHIIESSAIEQISYFIIVLFLVISIAIILSGCEIFANGVECISEEFNLSHATAGSLLAAVGTALPETLLPILALLFGEQSHKEGIAVGAILGAPFMLTTLAMFMLGVTTFILWLVKKRQQPIFNPNLKSLRAELYFFIPTMILVFTITLMANPIVNYITAVILLMIYVMFFIYAAGHEAQAGEEYVEMFYFNHYLACPRKRRWMIAQIIAGLGFIVLGAHIFIEYITEFSIKSGMSSLILALLIAPVATELPEKFNSITWTIKGKDTLAMSNISGAMIFQSTIPVIFGLLFTSWNIEGTALINIIYAIAMALLILYVIIRSNKLPAWVLLCGGIFYTAYILHIFA
ncbi:sodium/calcium exchanger membrane region [Candidatus Magnetoovum chiemensis]|nr:sodium/calcium exchanger membrane region [Candidatus Magnetoovum chiemensis]